MKFDPNQASTPDSGVFGLPFTEENAQLIIIPVPWEATTSYGAGTSKGPELVLEASKQVDLFDLETKRAYEAGYFMENISSDLLSINARTKELAQKIIEKGGNLEDSPELENVLETVNSNSEKVNDWLYKKTKEYLKKGKFVAVLGGDHASPYGAIKALLEEHDNNFGILHIDAHADLREAYEGFTWSHASVMYNVMTKLSPQKLIQVGIRDFSEQEYEFIQKHDKIECYFDQYLKHRLHLGERWLEICQNIISDLPQNVYISFDVDGFEPNLCPNTGTPVPGGLSFDQVTALLKVLVESGRKIVGFDLNEVSGGDTNNRWDAIVGARTLYKLCGWSMISNGYYKLDA